MLDHLGPFVPDMGQAAEALPRFGFRLTPLTPQRHRLTLGAPLVPAGTASRLAVPGQGYIEILTPIADTPRAQLHEATQRYAGLHLIALGTGGAAASHAHLASNGFAPPPVINLERTVETGQEQGLARFAVVRVPPGAMAAGRIRYCRHYTPELVWQERRLEQSNRARALSDVLLCVANPAAAERRARLLAGRTRPRPPGPQRPARSRPPDGAARPRWPARFTGRRRPRPPYR